MNPLIASDLWPAPVYEQVRDEFRRQVIAEKAHRRISVGPYMTFVFENRLTVKFQIQEILRAEKVTSPEAIQEELDGFNTMLPGDGELSATLLIELIAPEPEVKAELARLVGLADAVRLEVDGVAVPGRFDQGRDDGRKVSAVQYVRFAVGGRASRLAEGKVELVVDHPHYRHRVALDAAVRQSLQRDLG